MKLARVRIRCVPELVAASDPRHPHAMRFGPRPVTGADFEAYVVTEDGTEHRIATTSIEFKVSNSGEQATATLRILPDQVDVLALAVVDVEKA